MKKVSNILFWISLVLFAAMANSVFAVTDANDVTFLMTDNNSTTSKTFFDAGETPYLYIGFPDPLVGSWKADGSLWKNPDGLFKGFTLDLDASLNNWYTISNWNTVAKPGLWTVDAGYLALDWSNIKLGHEKLTFNFVPEPISSVLFLLGAGTLALRRMRKKA